MVVVVIIGILAVIAIAGYRHWVTSSKTAEATNMVGRIRERQEARLAETGGYLDVSNGWGPGNLYPASTPGQFVTAWGATCGVCKSQWSNLGVIADAPLLFGYATIADNSGTTGPSGRGVSVTINGNAVALPSQPNAPWYVVGGWGDQNGNGIYSFVFGCSFTNAISVDKADE
jgi:type II secretory pathway pseudopilin PulG